MTDLELQTPLRVSELTDDSAADFNPFVNSRREALMALTQRKKDQHLMKRIRHDAPLTRIFAKHLLQKPRAVLFRQIGTPTHEVLRFLRIAKQMKLRPLIFEYHCDKFVGAGNTYKRSLGKMPIYQYTGTDGRDMVKFNTVFDFNSYAGKPLLKITCSNGESLVTYHHRLLQKVAKINPKNTCVDASLWLQMHGSEAFLYYEAFLTLFVRDAILFENFESTPPVRKFLADTVMPAFKHVEARYGYAPLIVRLLPKEDETRTFWDSFPKKIERYI